MTMVTLISNPVQSASPFTSLTLPKECKMLLDPNASKKTPQQHKTPTFSLTAHPRDIPTYVSMTAESTTTADDYDDDCHLSHPLCVIDDSFKITPAFLRQWEEFYHGYIQLDNSLRASTPSNTAKTTASLPEAPSAAGSVPANDDPGTTEDQDNGDRDDNKRNNNDPATDASRTASSDINNTDDSDTNKRENNDCADNDDRSHDARAHDDRSINARTKTERNTTDPDDSYRNPNGNVEHNITHCTHEPKTDESDIDSTITDSHLLTTNQKILARLEELQVLTDRLLQLYSQPGFTTALTYTIHSVSPWNPDSLQTTTYNATCIMADDDRTFAPPPPPAPNPVDAESTGVLWPQPCPARTTIPFKKKSTTKHTFVRYRDQDLRPP